MVWVLIGPDLCNSPPLTLQTRSGPGVVISRLFSPRPQRLSLCDRSYNCRSDCNFPLVRIVSSLGAFPNKKLIQRKGKAMHDAKHQVTLEKRWLLAGCTVAGIPALLALAIPLSDFLMRLIL